MNIQSAIDAGLFVQFVATNWNTASHTTDLDGLQVTNANGGPVIAGKNYTVLKTIYANDLSTDLKPTAPGGPARTTIGIVAINGADPTDVFLAIRGTLDIWEWIQDAKFLLRSFPSVSGSGLTEDGFTDMYLSFSLAGGPPSGTFLADLIALLPSGANTRLTVAGHSLGGALSTLLALDLAANTTLPVTLYTLASPRVGDVTFERLFNHVVPNAYRIANRLDIVPKVPPPLLYVHVGDETELVPGPNLKFDLACEHHLTSYFNMLSTLIGTQAAYPIQPNCAKGNPAPSSQADV